MIRVAPRDRKRPVSAPGIPLHRGGSAAARPLSPPSRHARPRSGIVDSSKARSTHLDKPARSNNQDGSKARSKPAGEHSRFVSYRSFEEDPNHEEFLKRREEKKSSAPQVLVEPKWQVIYTLGR